MEVKFYTFGFGAEFLMDLSLNVLGVRFLVIVFLFPRNLMKKHDGMYITHTRI